MGISSNSQSLLVEKLSKASVNNCVCAKVGSQRMVQSERIRAAVIFIENDVNDLKDSKLKRQYLLLLLLNHDDAKNPAKLIQRGLF